MYKMIKMIIYNDLKILLENNYKAKINLIEEFYKMYEDNYVVVKMAL